MRHRSRSIPAPKKPARRREPKQQRARETVDAVLDGVVELLKRDGPDGMTTNRIAAVAGVSVGSVYQYFRDKRAIFAALHDRHVGQIAALVERTLAECAAAPLEDAVRALVEALVEAHGAEPGLHELLASQIAHGDGARAFELRLRDALRTLVAAHAPGSGGSGWRAADVERRLFVLPHVIEALTHAAAACRPPRLSLAAAKEEAVRAVLAVWRS